MSPCSYLWISRGQDFTFSVERTRVMHILDRRDTLSFAERLKRSHRARKGVARGVLLGLVIPLCFMNNAGNAQAVKIYITPKQYARLIIDDTQQYKCLAILYGKESAWNPDAKNGSHHGIPQGRSKYLATATPEEQIQWGLNYISHRYQADTCKALDHWRKFGWH